MTQKGELQPGLNESKVESSTPEHVKLAADFFKLNPSVLAEVQALLHKLYKNKNAGKTGWGDISPDTFRKRFTALMPEEVRKAYRKEVSGKDSVYFAEFVKDLIARVDSTPLAHASPSPAGEEYISKPFSPEEKTKEILAKESQVLSDILPDFEKGKKQYADTEAIFEAAKKYNITAMQAVRFLYNRFGFLEKFNELRKKTISNGQLKPEQALLNELVNILEPQRKEIKPDYFITMPYKDKGEHRILFLDVPLQYGKRRVAFQLPLGADIGRPENLRQIALDSIKKNNFFRKAKGKTRPEDATEWMAREFEKEWQSGQNETEKERIRKRSKFIKQAKPVFEQNPREFVKTNKLAEFASDIPPFDAVRYLADESLIGEYRTKEYKQFQEYIQKTSKELAELLRLSEGEVKAKNISREQMLLALLGELIKQARDRARQHQKDESGAAEFITNIPEEAELDEQKNSGEELEANPNLEKARLAAFEEFTKQAKAGGLWTDEVPRAFQTLWDQGLMREISKRLKNNGLL